MDTVKLPEVARDKLVQLSGELTQADAKVKELTQALSYAEHRLKDIPRLENERDANPSLREENDKQIAALEYEATRLRGVLAEQEAWCESLRLTIANCHELVASLRDDCVLEPVQMKTVRADITTIRREIAGCYHNIEVIERAPPVPEDLRGQVEAFVNNLAAQAAPKIIHMGGKLEVRFGEPSVGSSIPPGNRPPDLFAFLAWYEPEYLVEKLFAEVKAQRDPNSLPEPERRKQIQVIRKAILQLEREEEVMLCRKASQGHLIPRRSGASSLAILGIRLLARAREDVAA